MFSKLLKRLLFLKSQNENNEMSIPEQSLINQLPNYILEELPPQIQSRQIPC
jgi:hypothetical protein